MIKYEREYLSFIRAKGVGSNDHVASSPASYISYLNSVSEILGADITPSNLRSEADISFIIKKIGNQRASKTISNYRSAMRQYVAFVIETRL